MDEFIDLARELYIHNRITPVACIPYARSFMETFYGPCPEGFPSTDEVSHYPNTRRDDHDPYPEE